MLPCRGAKAMPMLTPTVTGSGAPIVQGAEMVAIKPRAIWVRFRLPGPRLKDGEFVAAHAAR